MTVVMCVFVTSSMSLVLLPGYAESRSAGSSNVGVTSELERGLSHSNSKAALEETVNDYFRRWQGVLPSAPPRRSGG